MIVVAFCGPEGAGKSTAAKSLLCHSGLWPAVMLPFARPLKDMLAALGVPHCHLHGTPADKAKPLAIFGGKSARRAMQTLGTEWGRACMGEDFWVNAWSAALDNQHGVCLATADDLRFENEARAVRELGGKVICVLKSIDQMQRTPKHASEDFKRLIDAGLVHAVVYNDGTPEELAEKVRALVAPRKAAQPPKLAKPSKPSKTKNGRQRSNGARCEANSRRAPG